MTKRYEAILLLGLELDERDAPRPELTARVDAAVKAYKEGAADRIVACGGVLEGHRLAEADVMAGMLQSRSVADGAIIREDKSQDTMENLRNAAKILGGAKGRRLLVVTSDYHAFRARMTARRLGFTADVRGAALDHDDGWKRLRRKELCFLLDLFMGWQDEGRSRPDWTMKLFALVFGEKR